MAIALDYGVVLRFLYRLHQQNSKYGLNHIELLLRISKSNVEIFSIHGCQITQFVYINCFVVWFTFSYSCIETLFRSNQGSHEISLSKDQISPARSLAQPWMVQVRRANLFKIWSTSRVALPSITSFKSFSRSEAVCHPLPKKIWRNGTSLRET